MLKVGRKVLNTDWFVKGEKRIEICQIKEREEEAKEGEVRFQREREREEEGRKVEEKGGFCQEVG